MLGRAGGLGGGAAPVVPSGNLFGSGTPASTGGGGDWTGGGDPRVVPTASRTDTEANGATACVAVSSSGAEVGGAANRLLLLELSGAAATEMFKERVDSAPSHARPAATAAGASPSPKTGAPSAWRARRTSTRTKASLPAVLEEDCNAAGPLLTTAAETRPKGQAIAEATASAAARSKAFMPLCLSATRDAPPGTRRMVDIFAAAIVST